MIDRSLSFIFALALSLLFAQVSYAQLGDLSVFETKSVSAVAAELVADVASIQPGSKFQVGIVYSINPGWHIYWRNPGDSGQATSINWQLPDGFTVGELRWPIPHKFGDTETGLGYGYTNQVMLMATVTVPRKLSGKSVSIGASTDWLMCKKVCTPGGAKLSLNLPVGESAVRSKSVGLFKKWNDRLPRLSNKRTDRVGTNMTSRNPSPTKYDPIVIPIEMVWPGEPALVEWFPDENRALSQTVSRLDTDANKTTMLLEVRRLKGVAGKDRALHPLVVWTDDKGKRQGVRLTIPWFDDGMTINKKPVSNDAKAQSDGS